MTKTFLEQAEYDLNKLHIKIYDKLNVIIFDAELNLTPKNYFIILDRIFIKESERRKGEGTLVINYLCNYADKYGLKIFLEPSEVYGTPIKVLNMFYKRFGFRYSRSKSIPLEYKNYHLREPQ